MDDNDASEIVKAQWDRLLRRLQAEDYTYFVWLIPLIDALRVHPRIRQLYPFTSHSTLVLARNTHYPYVPAGVHADAVAEQRYRVYGPNFKVTIKAYGDYEWREAEHEVLGDGNVDEAVALIESSILPNCWPAIIGDEDDVRRKDGLWVMSPDARALQIAALGGSVDEMAAILAKGTDVNSPDYTHFTPLMFGVTSRKIEVVRFLVENGADVHARTLDGETAAGIAAEWKAQEVLKYLESLMPPDEHGERSLIKNAANDRPTC